MKDQSYLAPFTGGTPSFPNSPVPSFISALKREVMELVYYGKYIEAKKRIELATIEANKEERMMCLKILYELASTANDDRLRAQILRNIREMYDM